MKTFSLNPTAATKKLLYVFPLFLIPFLTLLFWLADGGQAAKATLPENRKLLTDLPAPDLKGNRNLSKIGSYEEAEKDSAEQQNEIGNDFWFGKYFGPTSGNSGYLESGLGSLNQQEEHLNTKLEKLEKILNAPAPQANTEGREPFADETPHGKWSGSDPEMEQLDGMLNKIWEIQHPGMAKEDAPKKLMRKSFEAVPAVIEGKQKVSQGAVVKLKLLEAVEINQTFIPKNHFIYGTCQITNQRLKIKLTNIRLGNLIIPVDISVYDRADGMEGINVPDAILSETTRTGSISAVESLPSLPFDESVQAQLAGAGISAAKGLFTKRQRKIRIKLKDGYQLLLKDNTVKSIF
ncbi:conjugative transposon protein TraM [Pelobium manganitolerans]|uniref:conjugative transposon protein TraM n=1 Tax=Pelobium manganitolerans TaxID=1842495 RepID=UPI003FA3A345